MMADQTIIFKDWLPDLPQLDNPGVYEALNTIPTDQTYKQYLTLQTTDSTLGARCQGAFGALDTAGSVHVYAGNNTLLALKSGTSWNEVSGSTYNTASDGYWKFAQFDELVIATNYADLPQAATVGGATFGALATSGTAPSARHIAIVNRFAVLGDTNEAVNGAIPYRVQWPAIDNPRNWPTPGSSTAVAAQAGEQFLPSNLGAINGLFGGDQYGVIGQELGISRLTYVGGSIVFQFDTIDKSRGIWFPNGAAQVGSKVFFASADGFYVTDGVAVAPIGSGKCDRFFMDDVDQTYKERVYAATDYARNCIFWLYPNLLATSGIPNRLIIYNYLENRWARAQDTAHIIFNSFSSGLTLDQMSAGSAYSNIDNIGVTFDSSFWQGGLRQLAGFGTDNKMGSFNGAAATARFQTAEFNPNPGGFFHLRGARALVTGNPTAVTVALAKKTSEYGASLAFGYAITANSRSGASDFRDEIRFGALQLEIAGGFEKAMGLQIQGIPSSEL
jgi:hypothetical protein